MENNTCYKLLWFKKVWQIILCYYWDKGLEEKIELACHGNTRKVAKPYIATTESTKRLVKLETLRPGSRPLKNNSLVAKLRKTSNALWILPRNYMHSQILKKFKIKKWSK